jgi:hypothetical protein
MKTAILALALAAGATSAADAATVPECQVRILHPVDGDRGDHWRAGSMVAADILRRDGNGVSYCAHGGSCIPARVNGREVARLADCRQGKSIGGGDYRLAPVPGLMGARRTRIFLTAERVGDRLSALGFSQAGIGSWSGDYATAPSSRNGRLVARALAGSQQALAEMKAKLP